MRDARPARNTVSGLDSPGPPYVLVLYYSRHGNVARMARAIARGVDESGVAEARLRTVPSVSSDTRQSAPEIPVDGPPHATLADLEHCAAPTQHSAARAGQLIGVLGRINLDYS